MESLVYLGLAVVLFRGFVVEGYMISTGSMAPCLLGYHRQMVCPSCSFAFSRGTHFDETDSILASGRGTSNGEFPADFAGSRAICPNCGLAALDTRGVPRNEGDQLLVHKHLYQLRSPRRWEVVVFRHPNDPTQAYLKRVVGLPGEHIQVIDGDVYADGRLQRKSLATQRSMRIIVFDQDHEPSDDQWRPRWRAGDGSRWEAFGDGFVHRRREMEANEADIGWLSYHHWVRGNAAGSTTVRVDDWPDDLPAVESLHSKLAYDPESRQLTSDGHVSAHTAAWLRERSSNPHWQAAISQLQEQSHEYPIVDQYGYNHPNPGNGPYAVHDVMLEAVVRRLHGEGEWRLQMTDGWHQFETVFDFSNQTVRLYVDAASQPVREASFPDESFTDETTVEMSVFDRQVLVAIDGLSVFEPLAYVREARSRDRTTRPVRIGARELDLQLSHLRLYRDVYYTPRQTPLRNGPRQLGPDEYYMLGDNSPVSVDSRAWESPAIPHELLIGKPLVVHLPSQQRTVEVAGDVHHIRIPDFTRVRYIR